MNQKQLILNAISHKLMDIVPYQINFTSDEPKKKAEYYYDINFLSDLGNAIDFRP